MGFTKEVPIKYKSSIKKSKLINIKVTCKSITGDPIKEEVPKYLGEENGKHFLHVVKSVNGLVQRYDQQDSATVNGNLIAFETLSCAMTDDALDSQQKHVSSLSRRNSRSKAAIKRCIIEMKKEYYVKKCYENQLEYMKHTKKLEEIDISNFLKKARVYK